jgi:hypothetical protein
MIKEQIFRSEDKPFGIANGKSQIPKYGICNLRSEIPSASEDSLLQVCPSLSFNCEIRVQSYAFAIFRHSQAVSPSRFRDQANCREISRR